MAGPKPDIQLSSRLRTTPLRLWQANLLIGALAASLVILMSLSVAATPTQDDDAPGPEQTGSNPTRQCRWNTDRNSNRLSEWRPRPG